MPKFARTDCMKSRTTSVRVVGVLPEVRTAALGGWLGIQAGIWAIRKLLIFFPSPVRKSCKHMRADSEALRGCASVNQ
jgi:hypothetical protein